jgi:hypothetical protein
VHVNREIVDQVCAAALVLLTLIVAERPTKRLALLLGVVTGLAMLGNTRLVLIPVLCALYLGWRLPRARLTAGIVALLFAGAGIALAPWLIRNKADLGCWALTTDGRALWKANNPQTYPLLSSGQWIDNVSPSSPRPAPPNRLTPEDAWGYYTKPGVPPQYAIDRYPNECLQMRFYQHLAVEYVKRHPGNKAKLAALSAQLLWQPSAFETSGRPGANTGLDVGRRVVEPAYMIVLYVLAAAGLFVAPRAFVALGLLLLAYQTVCAAFFVGATRYRVAWDFILALLAAAVLARLATWARERKA